MLGSRPLKNETEAQVHEDDPSTFVGETKTVLLAALALIVALAWNSAFQSFFQGNTFLKEAGPWVYAVAVTIGAAGLAFALNQ